jgi:hypothetical protein
VLPQGNLRPRLATATTMLLKLRKFDLSSVRDDAVVIMLGKRNTGKSFLCKDLLSYHADVPAGVVISGTESSNQFYGDIFPPLFIYDEYRPEVVANLIKRQKTVIRKNKNNGAAGQVDPRAIFIMDDCLYDDRWTRDVNMRSIFMNGRHWKLMFIFTMQYPLGVPPVLRANIDYVFILREQIMGNRKRIYENYCGILPSFEVFCSVLDQTTENYECLVVDNTVKSNKIEDQIFYYRAEEAPPFTIGSKHLWNESNRRAAGGDGDSDEDEEPMDARAGKKRLQLTVKKTG